MQSDKLPKMPDPEYRRWLIVREGVDLHPLFSFEQMRDYALAARKAALEEVRAEMERRYDESQRGMKGGYEAGEKDAYGQAECWVEDLMEQDA